MTRFWVLIVVVALAGACRQSATPETSTNARHRGQTAWQQVVVNLTGANGEITKDGALKAFAFSFGPLPGVEVPERDGSEPILKCGPLHWLLAHWNDITPEQQRAARRLLVPSGLPSAVRESVNGIVRVQNPMDGGVQNPIETDAEYQRMAESFMRQIASRLSVEPEFRVVVHLAEEAKIDGAWMESSPMYNDFFGMPADDRAGVRTGFNDCVIRVGSQVRRMGMNAIVSALSHEVFHCFQHQQLGNQERTLRTLRERSWIFEGQAAWVGEHFARGSPISESWWDIYLDGYPPSYNFPLFRTEYTAIGFYAHLEQRGLDPWDVLLPMLLAEDNNAALNIVLRDSGILDAWPSSVRRRPLWGPDWSASGPGITDRSRTPLEEGVDRSYNRVHDVGLMSSQSITFFPSADVEILMLAWQGWGHARFEQNGGDITFSGTTDSRVWCMQGPCTCPPGTTPRGPLPPDAAGPLHVAITGDGQTSGVALVRAMTIEEFCEPEELECADGPSAGFPAPHQASSLQPGTVPVQVPGPTGTLGTTASCPECGASRAIDRCLVGTWRKRADGDREWAQQNLSGGERLIDLNASNGETLVLLANRRYRISPYKGDATVATAEGDIARGDVNIPGAVRGTWSAEQGLLNLCPDPESASGEAIVKLPNGTQISIPLPAVPHDMEYECGTDLLETRSIVPGLESRRIMRHDRVRLEGAR